MKSVSDTIVRAVEVGGTQPCATCSKGELCWQPGSAHVREYISKARLKCKTQVYSNPALLQRHAHNPTQLCEEVRPIIRHQLQLQWSGQLRQPAKR